MSVMYAMDLLVECLPLVLLKGHGLCASTEALPFPATCHLLHSLTHVYSLTPTRMHTRITQSLTICVICTSRTPSQDIVGIRLHRASIVLPPLQPRRGETCISVFCDGDLRKRVDCSAGE